jgi:hypothetical protein
MRLLRENAPKSGSQKTRRWREMDSNLRFPTYPLGRGEAAMVRSVDHQICFRLADAVPAASLPGSLRLRDTQAKALSELLQVFACGEESASLAS